RARQLRRLANRVRRASRHPGHKGADRLRSVRRHRRCRSRLRRSLANQTPASFIPIATSGDIQARTGLPPSKISWWRTYRWGWMDMIARTKPGVSDARADADLTQAFVKSL